MKNITKELITISTSVSSLKGVAISSLVVATLISLGSLGILGYFLSDRISNIYVLDKGAVSTASMSSSDANRPLELYDHAVRFHELFFNLSPSSEAITSSIDKALNMSDKSVYDLYMDMSEKRFYERMVTANISQRFSLDSIKTETRVYPYQVMAYGKLYLIRESNITEYALTTSCQMTDIARSKDNPHGLMIEDFQVLRNEKLQTRRRK